MSSFPRGDARHNSTDSSVSTSPVQRPGQVPVRPITGPFFPLPIPLQRHGQTPSQIVGALVNERLYSPRNVSPLLLTPPLPAPRSEFDDYLRQLSIHNRPQSVGEYEIRRLNFDNAARWEELYNMPHGHNMPINYDDPLHSHIFDFVYDEDLTQALTDHTSPRLR
jgi:hypothetical protein